MPDLTAFQSQRQRLFSIAYRMLGSATEAEDVLQDAWLRLAGADSADIHSREAFSTTVVTRLCLDRLKSARARRETYVGPWLPEPMLTSDAAPDVLAERSESVTLAFLVLLETLSPEERAVFLLKEVFDYEHLQIADMLGTTAANSRQLFHRAKSKIGADRGHGVAPDRSTAERFALAFQNGDVDGLRSLLAADVGFVSDGGGKVTAPDGQSAAATRWRMSSPDSAVLLSRKTPHAHRCRLPKSMRRPAVVAQWFEWPCRIRVCPRRRRRDHHRHPRRQEPGQARVYRTPAWRRRVHYRNPLWR